MHNYEILEKFKKLKKWKLFVVQNTHTDLGYTHRQEWVYRAHWKFIEKVIDICDEDSGFKWSCETFWTVENFLKNTTDEYRNKFHQYVASGNIEISTNYLNMSSCLTKPELIYKKATAATALYSNAKTAVFQDVNAVDREYAEALAAAGTKYLLGSIHTHHGMFVSAGKARPFWWKLTNNKKLLAWSGEHYQIGNELGLHGRAPLKYTFKDYVENETSDITEQSLIRIYRYLKLLEEENYPLSSLFIPLSGYSADNSAPDKIVLKTCRLFNELLGPNIEVKNALTQEFFEAAEAEIRKNKIDIPVEEGEWPDWWSDGVLGAPEELRLSREVNRIYSIVMEWNKNNPGKLTTSKIEQLENKALLFHEHTWGHWSSVGDPFWNENNLMLNRKRAMITDASEAAWSLLDEIRSYEGENYIKTYETYEYKVVNPYNKKMELTVPLPIRSPVEHLIEDRYTELIDNFQITDEQGRHYDAVITKSLGGNENLNTLGQDIFLVKVQMKPQETRKLTVSPCKNYTVDKCWTSSSLGIGAENERDLVELDEGQCKYNRNGIENKYFRIEWQFGQGIRSIFDKQEKRELITASEEGLFTPVHDVSPNGNRRTMGRNRKANNYVKTTGKLTSTAIKVNKRNTTVVSLFYQVTGATHYEIEIRLTNLAKVIDFGIRIRKTGEIDPENFFLRLPFENSQRRELVVHKEKTSFSPWKPKQQITRSCIDYVPIGKGVTFNEKKATDFSVGLYAPDTPMLQLGTIEVQRRQVMCDVLDMTKMKPYIWFATNYWETNFRGTLEGNYLVAFSLTSGKTKTVNKWIETIEETLLSFQHFN